MPIISSAVALLQLGGLGRNRKTRGTNSDFVPLDFGKPDFQRGFCLGADLVGTRGESLQRAQCGIEIDLSIFAVLSYIELDPRIGIIEQLAQSFCGFGIRFDRRINLLSLRKQPIEMPDMVGCRHFLCLGNQCGNKAAEFPVCVQHLSPSIIQSSGIMFSICS